jgi:hypothetical protein
MIRARTGYLPKNRSPAALGKMRKIPVISWVAAGSPRCSEQPYFDIVR